MRDIKFRGKDSDTGKWRYGYYVRHEKVTLCPVYENKEAFEKAVVENTEHYIIFDGFSDWNMTRAFYRADVDGKTVGQYTGMNDFSGKEIYEGDIVEIYEGDIAKIACEGFEKKYVVVFDDSELDFKATNGAEEYGSEFEYLQCCDKVDVIGNRWDNPELLGGAHDEH